MLAKRLREITTSRPLRRYDFYRFEAGPTLGSTLLLESYQVTYFLRQSTMELGVESL